MQKLGDSRIADELSDRDVITGITELTHAQNHTAADLYILLDQFARRGLNLQAGHSTPAHYLATGTRVARTNAARQFDTAAWLTQWPNVTEALRHSDIYDAHVTAIFNGYHHVRSCDATLTDDRLAAVVADLLDTARDRTAHHVKERALTLGQAATADVRARYDRVLRERQQREERARREREAKEKAAQEAKEQGRPVPPDDENEDAADEAPGPDDELLKRPPPQPVSENPALNTLDLYLQANGRTILKGDIDKVLADKLRAPLSPLSKPEPAPGGTPDPRSTSKRQADGLSLLLDQRSRRGHTPGPGVPPATVNVTVNLRDLLNDPTRTDTQSHTAPSTFGNSPSVGSDSGNDDGNGGRGGRGGRGDGNFDSGSGDTDTGTESDCSGSRSGSNTCSDSSTDSDSGGSRTDGTSASKPAAPAMRDPEWPFQLQWTGPISRSLARLLSCGADLNPIILDNNDVPLSLGDTVRLASPGQRAAVTVRDKCCIRCGLPAQWCQVHHIIFWEDDGPTDLDNLVLLCGDCHRLVHNHGWDVDFGPDGHPRVIPPAAIDPERKPIPSFHRQRQPAA